MTNTGNKLYFPNLDGLRFIGALSIILFHIDTLKPEQGVPVIKYIYHFHSLGTLSVSMFFVLSGFLITYLLLQEKESSGTIDLKAFYKRRILRIWPLYYFIIILGFFVFPHVSDFFQKDYTAHAGQNVWITLLGCLLFLPATLFTPNDLPDTMRASWSVRVEELFYFLWPVLFKKTKNYLNLCLGVVALVVLLRFGNFCLRHLLKNSPQYFNILGMVGGILVQYRVSCMAIGGIGAWIIVKEKNAITSVIYRKDVQILTYISTFFLLIFKVHIPFIYYEAYSVLFCIIILNLACNPQCILNLDYKWLNYLGKRSYGIYLYSPIVTIFCIGFVKEYCSQFNTWQLNLILYALVIVITITVSALSYQFIERPFLRIKGKYPAL
jgi:peptidoglycan/LPS O-acetylase OafA/YrhL